MCTNYRLNESGPTDIRSYFSVEPEHDFTGNLEPLDVFPRREGVVIIRNECGHREAQLMEWGAPILSPRPADWRVGVEKERRTLCAIADGEHSPSTLSDVQRLSG